MRPMNAITRTCWILLAAACGQAEPARQAEAGVSPGTSTGALTSRTDSTAGYPVTVVSGEPPQGAAELQSTIRGDLRAVRSVLVDPAGGVWVLDHGAKVVARYDDTGARVATLGRSGIGAGTYTDPYSLAWANGDIMIYDPGASRVGRWRTDGGWVGSWNAVPITGGANARFFASGSSGSAWLFQFSFLPSGQPAPAFARYPLTPTGDVRWIPPTERGAIEGIVICQDGANLRTFPTPFSQGEVWHPSMDGQLHYLRGVDYRIATIDSAGDTLSAVHRLVPQATISDAEWQAASGELTAYRAANPAARCDGGFMRPTGKAVVRALTLDDHGRLWVERIIADGALWEVWEGARLVGAIPGIQRDPSVSVDIRGDRMAVLGRGADGASEVRVYRISGI